jgi:hypothetical protein
MLRRGDSFCQHEKVGAGDTAPAGPVHQFARKLAANQLVYAHRKARRNDLFSMCIAGNFGWRHGERLLALPLITRRLCSWLSH